MPELDILAIGAHPDDVELCCGGTLAKSVKRGRKVGILDLTEGELGTRGNSSIRVKEAQAAAEILGCLRENLSLPDGNIEVNVPNRMKLIQILRKYRPRVLLIPHFAERHPDHVQAHLAGLGRPGRRLGNVRRIREWNRLGCCLLRVQ